MTNPVITQKITGFRVVNKDQSEPAPAKVEAPTKQTVSPAMKRPDMLLGSTYKIKPPASDHALYVTINDVILDEGTEHERRRPFEIFLNSKNMEHFQWAVALTRVISAVFRIGGDSAFLVDELRNVFDPQGGYFKTGGRYMPSLVAEIGEAINDHLKRIGVVVEEEMHEVQREILDEKRQEYQDKTNEKSDSSGFPPSATLCMKCHTKAVIIMDGCKTCLSCGDSKCS